jgi:DNA-binding transcriptional LysR family regulator
MMTALDISTVQAFLLVAELQSFTRAAEALGTTQAAVSMKLQRLEAVVGKRLVERSPRAVRLTADGAVFLENARDLMAAHDRALSGQGPARQQLSLGISDHVAGAELVPLLENFMRCRQRWRSRSASGFPAPCSMPTMPANWMR